MTYQWVDGELMHSGTTSETQFNGWPIGGMICEDIAVHMVGSVLNPPDMIGAARASLPLYAFEELMNQLNGRAPTARELIAKCEAIRGVI